MVLNPRKMNTISIRLANSQFNKPSKKLQARPLFTVYSSENAKLASATKRTFLRLSAEFNFSHFHTSSIQAACVAAIKHRAHPSVGAAGGEKSSSRSKRLKELIMPWGHMFALIKTRTRATAAVVRVI